MRGFSCSSPFVSHRFSRFPRGGQPRTTGPVGAGRNATSSGGRKESSRNCPAACCLGSGPRRLPKVTRVPRSPMAASTSRTVSTKSRMNACCASTPRRAKFFGNTSTIRRTTRSVIRPALEPRPKSTTAEFIRSARWGKCFASTRSPVPSSGRRTSSRTSRPSSRSGEWRRLR